MDWVILKFKFGFTTAYGSDSGLIRWESIELYVRINVNPPSVTMLWNTVSDRSMVTPANIDVGSDTICLQS